MSSKCTSHILKKLRSAMKNTSYLCQSLHAYIIPTYDAHQSEYISLRDRRRQYISGFSGSRGIAIVTDQLAALWTDGRYYLQAEQQLDSNWTLMKDGLPETPTTSKWLCSVLPVSSRVGVDPFLMPFDAWRRLSKELKLEGHTLIPVHQNLVDLIWDDQPNPSNNIVECVPVEYAGKTLRQKIISLRQDMLENKLTACVVTALDEVAWLFNLRGSDIEFNPVFFSYAIVTLESAHLFIDEKKLTSCVMDHLQNDDSFDLQIHPYESMSNFLSLLVDNGDNGKIWVRSDSSYAVVSTIPKACRVFKCAVANKKAVKNEQEIACMRNAHIKDAVALCEYFSWLSQEVMDGNITEISGADKLDGFRKQQNEYVGQSFETISASGPNGSIIHYKPEPETNRKITTEELYLCDSGGQYRDGTTDVTRTYHFGIPSSFEKECYTRVLKGHIALSSATFPELVKGERLDALARKSLWDAGLDYLHGTSHGVGVYLNVHEGPIGISLIHNPLDPGLQPGMILSIEPGYYEDNRFGIRLENLALVKKLETTHNFNKLGFLTFEPLTLVPFQTKLMDPSILTAEEIKWLNDYHLTCREVVGKALEEQGRNNALQWLLTETLPLG